MKVKIKKILIISICLAAVWMMASIIQAQEEKININTASSEQLLKHGKEVRKMAVEKSVVRVPGWTWQDQWGFSQAIKVKGGAMVFLAGQGGVDSEGNVVHKGDFKAQAKQVFENIKATIEAAGGSVEDIVWEITFVTDMRYIHEWAEVHSQYFKKDFPGSTIVEVNKLALEGMMIEVACMAVID